VGHKILPDALFIGKGNSKQSQTLKAIENTKLISSFVYGQLGVPFFALKKQSLQES
jgi:hypothetical protein